MNSSSNEAAALRRLTPRLAAALAASAVLHAALAAGLSATRGESSLLRPARPLQLELRDATPARESTPAGAGLQTGFGSGPLAAAPRYYTLRELDVKPGIMTRVRPAYPEAAARRFLSGKVRLRLFISESGVVERMQTLHADSPLYFEEPAHQAFRDARYSPGIKDGKPVKVRMTVELSFDSPPPPAPPLRR